MILAHHLMELLTLKLSVMMNPNALKIVVTHRLDVFSQQFLVMIMMLVLLTLANLALDV